MFYLLFQSSSYFKLDANFVLDKKELISKTSKIKGQSGLVEGHAYHLYIIEVEDRLGLYNYLKANNIFAQIHYIPTHLMPYYQQFGWKEGDFLNAEKYYSQCLSLPMYPTLSKIEQDMVISHILDFLS